MSVLGLGKAYRLCEMYGNKARNSEPPQNRGAAQLRHQLYTRNTEWNPSQERERERL